MPTQVDWDAEFAKYKSSPEYLKVNRNMTLEVRCTVTLCVLVHGMLGMWL